MVISVHKTKWMLFGPFPCVLPSITVNDAAIQLVEDYKYVGIRFVSTHRCIFAKHYKVKASKARDVANATFTVEGLIGSLPPADACILYMARVDPHLTFGAEVTLDVDETLLDTLADIQHAFIRRMLGLSDHLMLVVLFIETGLMPLQYRHIILALSYLQHLLSLPASHYAHMALRDSLAFATAHKPCWVSDLHIVLHRLPHFPVDLPCSLSNMEADNVAMTIRDVEISCMRSCLKFINDSDKTIFLHQRWICDRKTGTPQLSSVLALQDYLTQVPVPRFR